jgi:hypothetical protein
MTRTFGANWPILCNLAVWCIYLSLVMWLLLASAYRLAGTVAAWPINAGIVLSGVAYLALIVLDLAIRSAFNIKSTKGQQL